jgi:hypothetical protein
MQAHLSLLETHYGYSKSHIMILTDDPQRSSRYKSYWLVDTPTRAHLEVAFKRYISQLQIDAKSCSVIESMLVYSGHGSSQLSTRWDELDSQMECLLCTDVPFWDVDFFNQFESQLPSHVRHLSFFDSCMSGTMSNLPWMFNILSKSFNQSATDDRVKAECHAISGCVDSQTSAAEWKNGCSALTGVYLECLEAHKYQSIPLSELMVEMRLKLRERQNYQVPMWTSNRTDLTTCLV